MRTVLIGNPQAAAGRVGKCWDTYYTPVRERFGDCEARLSDGPGAIIELVREAIEGGAERLVVVGGDGSVNETVNGYAAAECLDGSGPPLLFLNAGTGADFSRVIGTTDQTPEQVVAEGKPRTIDVDRVTITDPGGEPATRYFVNIASLGASAQIAESVNQTSKRLGGKAAFMMGTLKGLAAWRNRRLRIRIDDGDPTERLINSIAISNGRCFGGGMKIAPDALLDDGLFDIVLVGKVGVGTFMRHGRRLYRGELEGIDEIEVLRGRRIEVAAVDAMGGPIPVETDGEHPGFLPLEAELIPGALSLIAPWARAVGSAG